MIIDADGHVLEAPVIFEKYLPEKFRDQAPKFVMDNHNQPRIELEGRLYAQPEGKGIGVWNGVHKEIGFGSINFDQRIKHMDQENIDISVLYPTLGLGISGVRNVDLADAMCQAYNNWLGDICKQYKGRLHGVAIVPLQDVDRAAKEVRRAVRDCGMVGVTIAPNVNGVNLDDERFYPFWAACQDLNIPVGIHGSPGVYIPAAGTERLEKFFYTHTVAHPFEMMIACMTSICGGVFEEFPDLVIAYLESGGGWVPFWMERLDEHFEKRPYEVPKCKKKPSEYMRSGNCYFSFEVEEKSLAYVVSVLGDDRMVFATDYPHWDCEFPHTVSAVSEREELTAEQKDKILGRNAATLYHLE